MFYCGISRRCQFWDYKTSVTNGNKWLSSLISWNWQVKNEALGRKIRRTENLPITNNPWTGRGLNPILRGERPVTSSLSHDTAWLNCRISYEQQMDALYIQGASKFKKERVGQCQITPTQHFRQPKYVTIPVKHHFKLTNTRVLILPDNSCWTLPAATPPHVWAIIIMGQVSTISKMTRSGSRQLSDNTLTRTLVLLLLLTFSTSSQSTSFPCNP